MLRITSEKLKSRKWLKIVVKDLTKNTTLTERLSKIVTSSLMRFTDSVKKRRSKSMSKLVKVHNNIMPISKPVRVRLTSRIIYSSSKKMRRKVNHLLIKLESSSLLKGRMVIRSKFWRVTDLSKLECKLLLILLILVLLGLKLFSILD